MKNENLGWPAIYLLGLIPILMWLAMQPLSTRFANFSSTMTSFGQLSALVGTVLLGITFVLNTRWNFVERAFGGLDKTYRSHHLIGTASFLMLLFHPLFLAMKFLMISAAAARGFLFPGGNPAINLGIFSLVLMILSLIFTFLVNLGYEKWRITHQILGLSLLLAMFHIFIIPSDISRNFILKMYIIAFVLFGFVAFFYRTIFRKLLVKTYTFKISKVERADNVTKITIDGKIPFRPGQFAFLNFKSIGNEFHPFSITSSHDGDLSFGIKDLGDYTKKVAGLKVGEEVILEGPYGSLGSNAPEQIWIAGGIGITPFMAMAKDLNVKADLYYCVGKKEEAVFLEELNYISTRRHGLRVIPFYSSVSGGIDLAFIEKTSGDISKKDIVMCGPPAMMGSLKESMKQRGIDKSKLHFEEFRL